MIVYLCNNCEEKIPIVKKKDLFTGCEIELLDEGKIECEMINLSNVSKSKSTHLCKKCAKIISTQIDNELLKFKLSVLNKGVSRNE